MSTQRGETSLADQVSSSLATCHPPLCFSHLILPYCSLPFCTHFFLPVIFVLREVILGYLLRDILHCAYCSNCLLRKEVGRNETATHSGFVMLLVSHCISLLEMQLQGRICQQIHTVHSAVKYVKMHPAAISEDGSQPKITSPLTRGRKCDAHQSRAITQLVC